MDELIVVKVYNEAYTKPRRVQPTIAATDFTPPFWLVLSAPLLLKPVLELIVVVMVIPLMVTVIVIPELMEVMEPEVVEAAAIGAVILASTWTS